MTKAQVKNLIEGDAKLQWFAAVLFAEVCELLALRDAGHSLDSIWTVIKGKPREFEMFVIQRMGELAAGGTIERPENRE